MENQVRHPLFPNPTPSPQHAVPPSPRLAGSNTIQDLDADFADTETGLDMHSRGSAVFTNSHVAFDYTNKRAGAFISVYFDEKSMLFQIIQDFSKVRC